MSNAVRQMSERICYLHVGMGKTGSSAIQFALTHAGELLKQHGYLYPDAAHNFREVLAGTPTAGNARLIYVALRDGTVNDAVRQVEPYAADPRHLVLSSEGFATRPAKVLTDFTSGLRSLGYRPKCLVFFRPHFEQAVSSYLQFVKSERTSISLSEYIEQKFAALTAAPRGSWLATARKLEQAVGTSNLTVKWYPAVRRTGPDGVVRVAFDWLGVGALYDLLRLSPGDIIINPTPGREALEILRTANANGFGGRKTFADEFLRRAQAHGVLGTKVTLSSSELQRVHAATAADEESLLRHYCPDLAPEHELALPAVEKSPPPLDTEVLRKARAIARDVLSGATSNPIRRRKVDQLFAEKAAKPRQGVAGLLRRWAAIGGKEKPSCIIHIGMHKTGSTSIQESLAGFRDDQFFYAQLGGGGNHSLPIFSLFSPRAELHHLHRTANRRGDALARYISDIWSELDRSITRARGRTLVISGEDISALKEPALAELRDRFLERFKSLTIVGYVRPPAGFMASNFQQRVKSGSIDFLKPRRMYKKYEDLFGKFDRVFGRDNVLLKKFDRKKFPDGCVVQDFCQWIGMSFPKQRIVRHNESLSRQAVAALFTYRKLGGRLGPHPIGGPAGTVLGALIGGNEKFRFSPEAVKPVLEANRNDIEWIEARIGEPLQEEFDEEQPGDVRHEADLLEPDPDLIERLSTLLRERGQQPPIARNAQDVASLVHALRQIYFPANILAHSSTAPSQNSDAGKPATTTSHSGRYELSDLVAELRQADPDLARAVSSEAMQGLLRAIFLALQELLDETAGQPIIIAGLGEFRAVGSNAAGGKKRFFFLPHMNGAPARPTSGAEQHMIVARIGRTSPQLPSVEHADLLLAALFRHILSAAPQGVVSYADLGTFKMKIMERDRTGDPAIRRRILFRCASKHSDTAAGEPGGGSRQRFTEPAS